LLVHPVIGDAYATALDGAVVAEPVDTRMLVQTATGQRITD